MPCWAIVLIIVCLFSLITITAFQILVLIRELKSKTGISDWEWVIFLLHNTRLMIIEKAAYKVRPFFCMDGLKLLTMKKICLFVFGIVMTVSSFAQSSAKFGLKAGVNISTLRQDNVSYDSRVGLHVGGLAHIHLAPQWALQPEVLYSQEGAKLKDVKLKLDYINIPLMLQYMFDNGFRIEAGPQLGLMVNSKAEDNDGNEGDIDDVFKTANVGLGFGLNYLSYTGLGVGGRYVLGLSDISESSTSKVKSGNFQISLFYMLDNSHKAKSR